jgi:Protein of unknown function (DUF4054)
MASYDDTSFRTQFPEFADPIAYPLATIAAYFNLATLFIAEPGSPCAVLQGNSLQAALNYMTAHLMVLSQQQAAAPGAAVGGVEISSSIGEVSVSRMAPPAKDAWDFWLYQTSYGQALMALLKVLSVGGFSVGGLPEREGFRKIGGVFF